MAQYPIKLLKDESGVPFVPLTSIKAVIGEEYIQSTFTATEDSTGHFTISNDKLVDEDLLNRIIAISFPEDITPTTNSYLKLNDGTECLIQDENGTGPLLIKDFTNVVCFIMKKANSWQLVKTGAEATASSGGHTIVDNDGNILPQQSVLQFKGFGVSDNAITGATVISTPSLINNLTTTESGTGPLDAYQGKILNDKFNNYALNSTLNDYALKTSLDNYALKTDLNSYLPLSGGTITNNLTINGELRGDSGVGLIVRSNNTGSWREGIRIYPASNNYALVYMGNEEATNGLSIVHNPVSHHYYIDVIKDSTTRVIHIPHADGTMALTSGGVAYTTTGGRLTAGTTTARQPGLRMYEIYANGYPFTYGNVLQMNGANGVSQLALQWHGTEMYYRSAPDTSTTFSSWARVWNSNNVTPATSFVQSSQPTAARTGDIWFVV